MDIKAIRPWSDDVVAWRDRNVVDVGNLHYYNFYQAYSSDEVWMYEIFCTIKENDLDWGDEEEAVLVSDVAYYLSRYPNLARAESKILLGVGYRNSRSFLFNNMYQLAPLFHDAGNDSMFCWMHYWNNTSNDRLKMAHPHHTTLLSFCQEVIATGIDYDDFALYIENNQELVDIHLAYITNDVDHELINFINQSV